MEVNRKEVPQYGQVEAHVSLEASAPEDAEFYIVVQGSRLTHVTAARRGNNGLTLHFTVPGHDLAEVVSVTSYFYSEGQVRRCEGEASLEYLRDIVQEVAEYLSTHRDQLEPQSYLDILKRLPMGALEADEDHSAGQLDRNKENECLRQSSGGEAGLRQLDEKITQAVANMDYPQQWKNTDSQPREAAELHPKETLLHLAVHLGLVHLHHFLLHQQRGQRAITLPNQEGDTALQLAQKSGQHAKFRELAAPPGPIGGPAPGVWCVWSDSYRMLRFCSGMDSLSLTVRQGPGSCPQDGIMFLRDRLGDHSTLKLVDELRYDTEEMKRSRDEVLSSDEGISKEQRVEEQVLVDSVFEEQLVLSLDDDDKEYPSSLSVNGHSMPTSGVQSQFTPGATDPPLSMISSSSVVQQTQVDAVDSKVSLSGVTKDSTGTDSGLWDTVDSDLLLATDTPPPYPEDLSSEPCSPPLSSAYQALARLNRPTSLEPNTQRNSPPMDTYDLSPSLVALEVDSEEDSTDPKPALFPLLSDVEISEDKGEAICPSPDLICTRSQSASSACEPTTKESDDQGIRLRSYSYSSSKISLRPGRFARDSPDGVLQSVSPSRSLLQALSLSKSLSLLHPGKQRASSTLEQSHEKREIRFHNCAQSTDDEGSMELAESLEHLTLSEFLKEIEEEELDKYSIPTKVESEKYKVIRTLSFLKNRMSSTRNKSKFSKGKGKDKEAKDRQLNGHRFATGSCLGPTVCVVCDKLAPGKDLLHCSSCTLIVHKGCKESVPPCLKKLQDKYSITMVKNRTASLPQNFIVRDSAPQRVMPISTSLPAMTPKEKNGNVTQSSSLTGSFPNSDSWLSESSETESDALKVTSQSEELLQTPVSSTSTDSSFGEDCVDAYTHSDVSAEAVDYEAESWSLAVEHKFCKKQDKQTVKRQDVIYELMQTELHHLQTLHIMAKVFRRGMREEVQLDAEAVERVFPCLDQLLLFHHAFFAFMKERRHSSSQPQGHRNYLIQRIGDILVQQFSTENGEKMKQLYGQFCSRHNEAVGFFKELLQQNKRFQNFIKQQGNNSLVRRREIPECILLVTQRITKYPVLLERILQYTKKETEEHADLSKALTQIREVIAAVDLRVSENERHQRLQGVWNRMENRSSAKLKNGHTFRKQDMMGPGQTLQHQGLLLWKTATGRLKDVLALLLSDTLIFLQEKDQKYTFATVDQKPPVIALQKLIVREVANEERGMFLISASAAGPEMYEVHTSSKEERNTWMRLIREAVESCPEEEEEDASESEEEKRAAEARMQKIYKLQENLMSQDQQICSSLEEKLQIYTELSALSGMMKTSLVEPRLLVQPHSEELPQAAVLLAAALQEAENLKAMLSSKACSPSSHSVDSDTDSVVPASPATPLESPLDSSEVSPENPEAREGSWTEPFVSQSPTNFQKTDSNDINLKIVQSVQSLTQLLYSLQAAVTIQDSCYEVQRLFLQETGRPYPGAQRPHLPSIRGSTLQEQEKQRNLAQRLQGQLRQEKERWERACQARESQQGEQESKLEERERQYHLEMERLRCKKEELDQQQQEYQQSLERLREGQRSVERDREHLGNQQKLLQTWKQDQQTTLPHMVIPLNGQQDLVPIQPRDHAGNGSVFVNEAAFTSTSINNHHIHRKGSDPSTHNCLNTFLARSNSRQTPTAKTPHGPHSDSQRWAMGTGYHYSPAGSLGLQHMPNDHNRHSYIGETWSSTASGADPYPVLPHPSDSQLDLDALVSMETDSGEEEEGREETIVYL